MMKTSKLNIILFLGLILIISPKSLALSFENPPNSPSFETKYTESACFLDLSDTPFSTPKEESSSSESDSQNSEKEFEKDISDLSFFQHLTKYWTLLFSVEQAYQYLTFSLAKFSLYLLDCAFLL